MVIGHRSIDELLCCSINSKTHKITLSLYLQHHYNYHVYSNKVDVHMGWCLVKENLTRKLEEAMFRLASIPYIFVL